MGGAGRYGSDSKRRARALHRTYSAEAAEALERTPRGRQSARISASILDSDAARTEFKRVMGFPTGAGPGRRDPRRDEIYDECYDAWVAVRVSAAGHDGHDGDLRCCLDHNEKVVRYGRLYDRAARHRNRQLRDAVDQRARPGARTAGACMEPGVLLAAVLAVLLYPVAMVLEGGGPPANIVMMVEPGVLAAWGLALASTLSGIMLFVWWLYDRPPRPRGRRRQRQRGPPRMGPAPPRNYPRHVHAAWRRDSSLPGL